MVFNINKGATLPILKLELIDDGIQDYAKFYDLIQNADIYFTMSDVETGRRIIGKKKAYLESKTQYTSSYYEEFYLTYQFTEKETAKAGTYIGKFIIEFLEGTGTLIVPINDELTINVLEGSIRK